MADSMKLDQLVSVWDSALELTKLAQQKNENPSTWVLHLSSYLRSARIDFPSPDLARLLVRHICFENHVPITWKLLEKVVSCSLAPPLLVLALLSSRVLPNRRIHPSAYRLYLELLRRHVFSLSFPSQPHYIKIMEAIDESMGLSQVFDLQQREPGILLAVFLFSVTWQLLDASLDDENLLTHVSEKESLWLSETTEEIPIEILSSEIHEKLIKANTVMAIETIGELLANKTTSRIIHLSRRNLPSHWRMFNQRVQLLASQSSALNTAKGINGETLIHLISEDQTLSPSKNGFSLNPIVSPIARRHGSSSSLWIPLDIFLEDVMDGSQVAVSGAIKRLLVILKALQSINKTSWHDAFLGLLIGTLRLVQREREPSEGPMPRIDTSLCMLLSIAILAVASIVEDEESDERVRKQAHLGLITCLQQLGEFENLLIPPQSIAPLANQAAIKAIMFVSGLPQDPQVNHFSSDGNLRHLIVESCIARNLLDTSAYFWPGYTKTRPNLVPRSVAQPNGWSLLMKGSPLTPSLANVLATCPASSVSEVQKVYEIAIHGSDEEKILAGSVLCGASLVRGWSIQECTLLFIVNLLCPPTPADLDGNESLYVNRAPLLNVLVVGISPPECVQMYTLHGLVPILATALLPICEVVGSLNYRTWTLPNGEELTSHAFFSNAFTLLLRLWRFDKTPLEHVADDVPPVGTQLSPEFLMLVRNRQLGKSRGPTKNFAKMLHVDTSPVNMDSFPKLKQWYRQHVECIASAVSGLARGTPVHQIVDSLLTMMFRKINYSYAPAPTVSGSSSSSGSIPDDACARLRIPAWDILEACPFALDAALTACSHGKLFPRELATGLKDLADFLPASLAVIVSYFSAEVTRGVWKPASMNGTDWPSPAANLSTVEQHIKKILAATGVDVPSLSLEGTSQLTLPLPLAAFVSLTITYKLEKTNHRFLVLIGPYLNALATSCPWPCLPIVSALWIQKVKRWKDFFIFSASRSVFHHNNDAVVQLLESCFTSVLGFNAPGGVGGLLGHSISPPVAPGFLYIRVHRAVRNVMFLTEEILSVLMQTVRRIAGADPPGEAARIKKGMRYREGSYSTALEKVKLAAALGASLVWVTGGLALVQSLMKEILPSWFISGSGGEGGGAVAMLGGYAVAYMAVLCGAFAWGIDSVSPAARRRGAAMQCHMEFVASALEGKISMGCHVAMTKAYVVSFLSLVVTSAPAWIAEVDARLLRKLSSELRRCKEDDLALLLLCHGGVPSMGFATDLILETESKI